MPKGNWGVLVAALFGLAMFSAIGGYVLAASGSSPVEWYPDYTDVSENAAVVNGMAPAQRVSAPKSKRPCRNPTSREESDLCAQWVAANAARQNVLWTERHFWVGLVTVLGLALTVILTLRSVRASERSLEHAREASYAELKAYLGIENSKVVKVGNQWHFETHIKNYGQTPAIDSMVAYVAWYMSFPVSELPQFPAPPRPGRNFAPQQSRPFFTGALELSPADISAIEGGTACILVRMSLAYTTHTGERVIAPTRDVVLYQRDLDHVYALGAHHCEGRVLLTGNEGIEIA